MNAMNRTRNAFTLIEMLMVIVIISVLMGMILPAVHIAKQKAKIVQAKTEARSIITAVKMYESTYGYLPVKAGSTDDVWVNNETSNVSHSGCSCKAGDYEHLIAMLTQTHIAGTSHRCSTPASGDVYPDMEGNSRKIRMLEVKIPGQYQDPWGQDYQVIIDANYDGKIEADPTSGPKINGMVGTLSGTKVNVPTSVVVWSWGPDKADSATAGSKSNQDNVYTFDTNWSDNGHVLR